MALVTFLLLVGPAQSQQTTTGTSESSTSPAPQRSVDSSQLPPSREGHPPETNPGRNPHGSNDGAAIGAAAGAAAAGVFIGELIAHHNASPEKLGKDGPQVPKEFDMGGFEIKGLVHPNWPIVLDFMLYSPGIVRIDVIAADKNHYAATISNTPNRRAYAIIHLPADFGKKLQTGVYQVRALPPRVRRHRRPLCAPMVSGPETGQWVRWPSIS